MQKLPSESETPGASPSCAFPGLQHSTVLLQSAPAHRTPRASSARSVTAYLLMDIPLFQRAHIVPKAILRAAVRVEALPAVAYPAPALRSRLNPEQMHLKTHVKMLKVGLSKKSSLLTCGRCIQSGRAAGLEGCGTAGSATVWCEAWFVMENVSDLVPCTIEATCERFVQPGSVSPTPTPVGPV